MKPSKFHKIFEDPQDGLTPEQLKAYVEGKLDREAQHATEVHMQASELHAEAAEGFEAQPEAFDKLAGLQQAWDQRHGSRKSIWAKPAVQMLMAGLAGGGLVLFGLTLQPEEEQAQPVVVEVEVPAVVEEPVHENFIQPEPEPVAEAPEPEVVEAAPPEVTDPLEEAPVAEPEAEENQPAPVESAPEKIPQRELTETVAEDPAPPVEPAENWAYIDRYKVFEYGDDYGISEERFGAPSRGVSARFENDMDQRAAAAEVRTITHQYSDVLELGIAHLDARKYRKALNKFKLILEAHPEDLNGLFYGGFCYHHLRSYNKAVNYFDLVLESQETIFHEEARWYKALSLSYGGKWEEGKALLEEIAAGDGFYAKEARKQIHR